MRGPRTDAKSGEEPAPPVSTTVPRKRQGGFEADARHASRGLPAHETDRGKTAQHEAQALLRSPLTPSASE